MKVFSSLFVVLMAVIMIGSMVSVEANPRLGAKSSRLPTPSTDQHPLQE
ncbi:Protein CBG25473 [Caenorhabditis briggsae]|uniref:Protein CBG25473 n=1 Tax=Caenorhabditis briggsae TaxID=6238 RepID=B6IFI7_CAEBR|nr:Protein CBG25473 [Caenorhabditis briggsae]CAR98667.1 Protein CBG25473 [Caenorhabditis briggsae]